MNINSNLKCIENLLNIQKKKSDNINSLLMIINSFQSNLNIEDLNYLYNKFINYNIKDELLPSLKRRRIF